MSGGRLHDDFTHEPISEVPGQSCSGESVTNFVPGIPRAITCTKKFIAELDFYRQRLVGRRQALHGIGDVRVQESESIVRRAGNRAGCESKLM